MKEGPTPRQENQQFIRINPEGEQQRSRGGASGRENRWQNPREARNPFANQREQTVSDRENIHNLNTARQEWLDSMRGGKTRTLEEIRDLLRRQEIRQKLADMEAFSIRLNENLTRGREEALAATPDGEEQLTAGQLVLKLLFGLLALPAEAARQTAEDTVEQAKKAA
jgi:hypothetical protein